MLSSRLDLQVESYYESTIIKRADFKRWYKKLCAQIDEWDDHWFEFKKNGNVVVHSKKHSVNGKLDFTKGNYSQWQFDIETRQGPIRVITNNKLKAAVVETPIAGPQLGEVSPTGLAFIMENPPAIDRTNFSAYDAEGKGLINDDYAIGIDNARPHWVNNQLVYLKIYESKDQANVQKPPQALAKCGKAGAAMAKWVGFDMGKKTLQELAKPEEWVCRQ